MQGTPTCHWQQQTSSSLSTTNKAWEQPPAGTPQPGWPTHKPCGQQRTEAALEGCACPSQRLQGHPCQRAGGGKVRACLSDAASALEEGRDWNGFCQFWVLLQSAGLWALLLLKTIKYRERAVTLGWRCAYLHIDPCAGVKGLQFPAGPFLLAPVLSPAAVSRFKCPSEDKPTCVLHVFLCWLGCVSKCILVWRTESRPVKLFKTLNFGHRRTLNAWLV